MAEGPNIGLIVPRMGASTEFYRAADQMDFHALWPTAGMFGPVPPEEQLTALSEAAAATSRIRLGATQLGTWRDPVVLATEAARLDHLSGGRLTLGMSQHGTWPDEGVIGGSVMTRSGGRLEETITVVQRLWREAEVSFRGSHFRLDRASIPQKPVQPGGIPILVGGISFASVRLAATLAEGWVHPSGGLPEEMGRYRQAIRALASQAGRYPDSLKLGKIIYLAIDDDRARARARLSPLQRRYGPRYNVDLWCAFGPPAECAAFIRRFLDTGIMTVLLSLTQSNLYELERLHREVVPRLK